MKACGVQWCGRGMESICFCRIRVLCGKNLEMKLEGSEAQTGPCVLLETGKLYFKISEMTWSNTEQGSVMIRFLHLFDN